MEDQIGIVWTKFLASFVADSIFFDAEWRGSPGFPNLEPGFPIMLPAGVISPPGICELDGDPEAEIVFGGTDGKIHVINHDGTPLPGWPIAIGIIPQDSPVAVGDLDGDGQNEIVCGSAKGLVSVFNADGTVPI